MISLDQIRILERKVEAAVSRIRSLTQENLTLKASLESYESRIQELESMVSSFKSEQDEIEAGIVSALRQLDDLEHTVGEKADSELTDGPATEPAEPEAESSESTTNETPAASHEAITPAEEERAPDPQSEDEHKTEPVADKAPGHAEATDPEPTDLPEEDLPAEDGVEEAPDDSDDPELDIF